MSRTLEYALPGCGVGPTLEYATTKEECSLESKSCIESVAAPTPASTRFHLGPQTPPLRRAKNGPPQMRRLDYKQMHMNAYVSGRKIWSRK